MEHPYMSECIFTLCVNYNMIFRPECSSVPVATVLTFLQNNHIKQPIRVKRREARIFFIPLR